MRTRQNTATHDLTVVGVGYVGLPLARAAVRAGRRVAGYDTNHTTVQRLRGGHSHVGDVPDVELADMLHSGFLPTDDPEVISDSNAIVICVPTPLGTDHQPDLSYVLAAAQIVGEHLTPGTLIVLESTTYPGTTDGVVRQILEEASHGKAGLDFNLAYSPERIDPGNRLFNVENTPKIVSGLTADCAAAAMKLYGQFIGHTVLAKGLREAELAKLLENTYRNVNIALVNEMAAIGRPLGIDVWNAIDCAATKPFGFHAFYPGAGVGGHCIPVDPEYLTHVARRHGHPAKLVETALQINAAMPCYVANRAAEALNERGLSIAGSSILLLGVTYKANVSDLRESPAVPVAEELRRQGAIVSFHDPYINEWHIGGELVARVADLPAALETAQLTILLQGHRNYDPENLVATAFLLDTCGFARFHGAEML